MRERRISLKPGNVYGDKRNPVELEREDRRRALGKEREAPQQEVPSAPIPEQVPGTSSDQPSASY